MGMRITNGLNVSRLKRSFRLRDKVFNLSDTVQALTDQGVVFSNNHRDSREELVIVK